MKAKHAELQAWRALQCTSVFQSAAIYAKRDPTYVPAKDPSSERWHVKSGNGEFELLVTGNKFFDTRAKAGGGGGVDLLMHISATNFKSAVALLRKHFPVELNGNERNDVTLSYQASS